MLLSIASYGQLDSVKESLTFNNGKVKIFSFDTVKNVPKLKDSVTLIKRCFNLSENDKLVQKSKRISDSGIEHTRFQQYHSGIKVEDAEIIINSKNGNILSINGEAGTIDKVSLKPELNRQNVIEIAKLSLNAKKFAWESPEMESYIKQVKRDKNASFTPKPELVLWNKDDSTGLLLSIQS